MPILDNPRHERFAQELAKGKSATEAYIAAGYDTNEDVARRAASRLLTKVDIKARVEELLSGAAERAGVTIERVLTELAKIGFANMQHYMRAGPDGDPFLDFSALTEAQAAALQEVTVEDFKDGRGDDARDVRRIKFKLYDKRAALVDLGKHLGMFKERIEHTGKDGGPITTADISDNDVARRVGFILAKGIQDKPTAH